MGIIFPSRVAVEIHEVKCLKCLAEMLMCDLSTPPRTVDLGALPGPGSRATQAVQTATGQKPGRGRIHRLGSPQACPASYPAKMAAGEEMHLTNVSNQMRQSPLLTPQRVLFPALPEGPATLTLLEREAGCACWEICSAPGKEGLSATLSHTRLGAESPHHKATTLITQLTFRLQVPALSPHLDPHTKHRGLGAREGGCPALWIPWVLLNEELFHPLRPNMYLMFPML